MNNNLDTISTEIDRNNFEDYKIKSNTNLDDASNNFWSLLDTKKNLNDQSLKEDSYYITAEFQTNRIYVPGIFGSIYSIMCKDANLDCAKTNFKWMNMAVNDIEYYPPLLDHPHRYSLSKISIQSNCN